MQLRKFPSLFLFALAAHAIAPAAAGTPAPTTVHVHTSSAAGFLTNSVWLDDGEEITVIDTQFTPALAEALVADIRSQTARPIRRVIVTHPNPDKFNGLSVFHALGAQSLASEATTQRMPGVHAYKRTYWIQIAKAFTEATYPRLELPRQRFSGRLTVPLKNGDQLVLQELQHPGVSATQTVVQVASTGDVVVGDLVANRHHAWLEGGVDTGRPAFDLAGWQAALVEVEGLTRARPQARLFAGRGPVLPAREALPAQRAYLAAAEAVIQGVETAAGADRAQMNDPARQASFVQQIQQGLAQRFPAYAMPDLVGYSVYGWLASRVR